MLYNFTMTMIKGYYGTATITMTADKPNTVYSMRVRSADEKREESSEANTLKVEPGEPNYMYVFNKPTCLKGFFKSKGESLFISFYASER